MERALAVESDFSDVCFASNLRPLKDMAATTIPYHDTVPTPIVGNSVDRHINAQLRGWCVGKNRTNKKEREHQPRMAAFGPCGHLIFET